MRQLLAVAALLVAPALFAAAETAEDIVARLQANQVFRTSRMQGVMTVTDRFGAKETRFVSYARGEAEALIEFTSTEEKGQKILRTKDEIYLFYPDAEEVIRLQGAAFRDAVLGSDMSYEDLTGGKTLLETYRVSLEGTELVDGAECYRIRMEAKARNVAYPVQVMWIDPKLWSARRMQQFSLAGRLLKEISLGSFQPVAGRTVATRMVLEDKLKKNSRTVFTVERIEVDIPLDPKLFTLEHLSW
jgi:outer membrane lipoprotein-sorting protein